MHYNGTDLKEIYNCDNNGIFLFEKDVFILSKEQYNIVIHGRLED